jgi:hypothetical protein
MTVCARQGSGAARSSTPKDQEITGIRALAIWLAQIV